MREQYGRFTFRYTHDVDDPGKVRIYVEGQPSYNGQATDGHSTHRISHSNGAPPHICIKEECRPSSLAEAQEKAHQWADATENYIRTGRKF